MDWFGIVSNFASILSLAVVAAEHYWRITLSNLSRPTRNVSTRSRQKKRSGETKLKIRFKVDYELQWLKERENSTLSEEGISKRSGLEEPAETGSKNARNLNSQDKCRLGIPTDPDVIFRSSRTKCR